MKNRFARLLLALSLLFAFNSFAQQEKIDSLRLVLSSQTDDTTKVNTLNRLSRELWNVGSSSEAMEEATKAKELAETLNFKKGLAKSYRILGMIRHSNGEEEQALSNFMNALRINEQLDDQEAKVLNYTDIGLVYTLQGNNDRALEYFEKAEALANSMSDKPKLGTIYQNISTVYINKFDYEKAMRYALKAKEEAEKSGDKMAEAMALDKMGIVYENQGNLDAALKMYNDANAIHEQLGDKLGMVQSETRIGNVYSKKGNYNEAMNWHKKAVLLATDLNDMEDLRTIYEMLSSDNRKLGKMEMALSYYMMFKEMNDSIVQSNFARQLNEMQVKFETEKKESELTKMESELKSRKRVFGGFGSNLVMIAICVVLFFVFLIYLIISQQKIKSLRYQIESQQQMNQFNNKNQRGNFTQW